MESTEYRTFRSFVQNRIYPEFGKQPSRFRNWDKKALRSLYVEYLKPQYHIIRNNPKIFKLIKEVQHHLEYD